MISEIQTQGYLDSTGTFVPTTATNTTLTDGRSTQYNVYDAYERYVWTTGTDYSATTDFQHDETDIFHSSSLAVDQINTLDLTSGPNETATGRLANGTYVTTISTLESTGTAVGGTERGIVISNSTPVPTPNSALDGTPLVVSTYDYLTSANLKPTGSSSSCNWWTLCIASNVTDYYELTQTFTQISTYSLKADYPIGINFIGSNTGNVSVASAGSVVLTGNVTNVSGATTVKAGLTVGAPTSSIIQGENGALITSKSIDLEASSSIGGVAAPGNAGAPPVAIALRGGALTAIAGEANGGAAGNGRLSIATAGNLVIAQATASVTSGQSSAVLSAGQNIRGAAPGSFVQADAVQITATNGTITGSGGAGTALSVNTGYTSDPSQRQFGDPATNPTLDTGFHYGLKAAAAGDIDIAAGKWADDVPGTLLIDTVVSSGGNVTLSAPGQILDNNPVQIVDTRTYNQLLNFWNSLDLLGGATNAAGHTVKQQATIDSFNQSMTQEYQQYWRVRLTQADGGAAYDPNFTVTIAPNSQQYAALSAQYSAQILASNPSISKAGLDAQVATDISDFVAAQTSQYHSLNSTVGGLSSIYDPNFKYVASAQQDASLTHGAVWTQDELAFAFSAGILKTVTDTNPVLKAPNVAGRIVTIDAGVGIGETIVEPGQSLPGVIIPAGLAPSALTDDQKVAIAAAERSDLSLTIGSVQLPFGETFNDLTPDQQAAYLAASGLTNVTIPLGANPSTWTADQQAALQAAALGLANFNGSYLSVLVKRPLNFAATTALNVTVADFPTSVLDVGDAYLASQGNAPLGAISTSGETRIKVLGSIGNAAGSLVQTGNLILEAANGDIGYVPSIALAPLDLSLRSGATLTARAENGVIIAAAAARAGDSNDANVDTIYSPQDIVLTAEGSILNANDDKNINILGATVTLNATTGSIGTVVDTLNVGVIADSGWIKAFATTPGAAVDLYGPSGANFIIRAVEAGGPANLTAAVNGTIDGDVQAGAQIDMTAGGSLVLTQNAFVTPTTEGVTIDAATLKMLNGAVVDDALGDVDINTSGDALVTGITSGASDAQAVSIVAGGHVLAGTNPVRVDIAAMSSGAGVSIAAGLEIGDEMEADSTATDNTIVATPNPLIIETAKLFLTAVAGDIDVTTSAAVSSGSVTASNGSINLTAEKDFSASNLDAPLGSVSLIGAGAVAIQEISAGTGVGAVRGAIAIDAATTLTVGTATSGGTQTLTAEGDLTFTRLTTAGIPGDAGDVDLTSVTGLVQGGDTSAHGAVTIHGRTVALDDIDATLGPVAIVSATTLTGHVLTSGGSASLTAGGDIDWGTLTVGTQLSATSTGGAIALGTATSGGTQTLTAEGDLTFTRLTTTGIPGDAGDVDLTSVTGLVQGGDTSAHGAVTIHGRTVALDDIDATLGPVAIVSATTLTGHVLTSGGSASLTAGGDIDWGTLTVGTQLSATSTGGAIALGTATSGGTQTLTAEGDLTFTRLTTTGIPGDAGDVDLTSVTGLVQGGDTSAHGAVTIHGRTVALDDIDATLGPVAIVSATTLTGHVLTSGGSASLTAGGDIDWGTLTVGTQLSATSTGGAIALGTATSGGTQTLTAEGDLTFTRLTTAGIPGDAAMSI